MIELSIGEPIPSRQYRKAVYPFKQMKVGSSFDVTVEDELEIRKATSRVSSACVSYAKKNSVKFTLRKVDEKTIRVWMIEVASAGYALLALLDLPCLL